MKALIVLLNLAFLGFFFYKLWRQEKSVLRIFFVPALTFKLLSGILLGLLYTYYYSIGDTFLYFQDGVRLASLARKDITSYLSFLWSGDDSFPIWSTLAYQQPRAMFLSKVTSLFCLLTSDNYWVTSLYFSGIAFAGAWIFLKKIDDSFVQARSAAILGFLFFPSAVFWSAGIIKESLAMASLFFLSFIFLKTWWRQKINGFEWLGTVLAVWLVWNLKYYYLAIFLPVVFTALALKYVLSKLTVKSLAIKILLWCLLLNVPLLIISILHPNFYVERFTEVVVASYYEFEEISNPEDMIHYNDLEPTPVSIVTHSPWALLSGLFRPFVTEARASLQWLIALENLLLLTLSLAAITQTKKLITSRYRLLLFSILMYSALLCVFLALSTPNFGTLSRYRVGFLPYFVFVISIGNPLINKLMMLKIFRNLVR